MTTRMRFVLDGDDHLSPALNRAGDSSARLHHRLNDDMNRNGQAVRRFTQDADGRLRDLRGRFISVADAQRMMGDGMPDLTRRLGDVSSAGQDAAASMGSSGGGLGGVLMGVAAAAGLSLLPALGALVPMIAGAGLAAGTLKLGFAGVTDAMAAAGKGKKEYAKALKELSPPARDFTKALVGLKKEFGGVGKDIQKAMLPGFTKAVKAAGPLVKILGEGMTELGGAFGKAAEGAGRLFKDSGFQRDLKTNLDLGRRFIGDLLPGLGKLGRSFLDFGAASKPTLTALSGGIRDVLGKGLPGMFDGLKVGIEGSSKFLSGFFTMINDFLPAIGRFSGEVARALGPMLGQLFESVGVRGAGALDTLGQVVKGLVPVFKDLGYGFKAITQISEILGPTIKDTAGAIVGSLLPSFSEVDKARGPLQRLSDAIQNNKGAIQEFARQGATAFLTLVQAGVQNLPTLVRMVRLTTGGMVVGLGGVLHAAASAFSWIPGIGDKLKDADKKFGTFTTAYLAGLKTAEDKASEFAASTVPKLEAGKLRLDINNWQSQIETAKAKLKTVPPSKQAALRATIDDLQAKVNAAKGQLGTLKTKNVSIRADTSAFTSATGSLIGRVLGTSFINVSYRKTESQAAPTFRRHGGPAPRFAGGGMPSGMLQGPGTGTSDSIPMWWGSNGEYVVNARSTAKHRSLIEAINSDRLGSGTGGAGLDAGKGLIKGMADSTSGVASGARRMAAAVETGIRAELQIASPSKKTKALAYDTARGFLEGLTRSRDKIKSTAADLVKDIKTAFSGKKESGLIRMVDKQSKKLLDLAAKRDKLASTIATAKKYASDTTAAARENAGLANLGMEPDQVSAGGIKGGLAAKLAQVKQFTKYVDMLAKRGLNKGLLRQILNMGPEAGYAYASALAGADKNTFNSINSLQTQLDKSTTTLGQVGADRLYDAGKNAGKGFLKGLEGQQKDIENLMMSIAKGMQKAIKKALGIKSPSTVMAKLGSFSTQGLARGLVEGVPHLDRALDVVTGRVAGAQPALGRTAVSGAGSGVTYNVNVNVAQAMDPVAVGREFQRVLVQLGRAQGAKVNLNVGGAG